MNTHIKPTITFNALFSTFDWIVFLLILFITVSVIIYGNRLRKKDGKENKQETFLDHLVMGRKLTLPLFVGTLVATWYGGIFGVTEIAFKQGIFNFVTQGLFWYVTYLLFAFFVINKVAPYKAVTLPNLIHKMFGPRSAMLGAFFNFFNVVPIVYAISLGLLLKTIFGGPLWLLMLIGVSFAALYSCFGGLRAVVFSDFIQFTVMCLAVFLVLLFSLNTFGGLEFLQAKLPAAHFKLTGEEGWAATIVWGFIALATLIDPNFYQRVFAAKSPRTARNGIIISTCIWFCFDICTTLGAMYARAVIPDAASGQAYLIYSLQILPIGLRGFFIAGLLATILSTLDSYLFIAGTTISYDMTRNKSLRHSLAWHRINIWFVGFLAIFLALVFDGHVKLVWKTLGSYFAACLLLPVVFGYIFPKKISDNTFVLTAFLAAIAVTYWRNASHQGFWVNVDELYIGLIVAGLTIFVSLLFAPRPRDPATPRSSDSISLQQ